jgi:predicted neutral ceramidase superfamily lipid hydrolase
MILPASIFKIVQFKMCPFYPHSTSPTSLPTVDDAAVQRAVEEVAAAVAHQETEPQMNHVHLHDIGHGEAVSYHAVFHYIFINT